MRAVAGRRRLHTHEAPPTSEEVRKRFTPAPGEGAAERGVAQVLNASWPVLDTAASTSLAHAMIAARDVSGYINGLPWSDFIVQMGAVVDPMAAQIGAAVRASVADMEASATISFLNEDVVSTKYAQQQSGKLIAAITESQRESIRSVMGEALQGRHTVDEAARIVRGSIGLHPAWADAVTKYRLKQEARFVREGASPAAAAKRADKMALTYRNRLVARRAQTIARTEIQTASNLGRYAGWAQMIGSGVAKQTSMKEWSPGPGACERCAGISGETVLWDAQFSNGLVMPPAHPNCRCTAVLVPARYKDESLNAQQIDWLSPVLSDVNNLGDIGGAALAGDPFGLTPPSPKPVSTEKPMSTEEASDFFNTNAVTGTPDQMVTNDLYHAGTDWNRYLRTGEKPNEFVQEHIDNLTALIDAQPQLGAPATLYRGLPKNLLPDLQPGTVFKDEGFMSTTLNPSVASKFAGTGTAKNGYTPILEIIADPATKGLPMNVLRPGYQQLPDALAGEAEIILHAGTTLRIVSIEEGRLGGWTHQIVKAVIVHE